MKILIVGYSVRHMACSAARAGHNVYAADSFCDLDLEACSKGITLLPQPLDARQAESLIQSYIKKFSPDAVVLGPGLEETGVKGVNVLNNPPEKAALVSDKLWLAGWLEEKGFPFIPTGESSEKASFPAVIKPRKGAGGVGCKLVKRAEDMKPGEDKSREEKLQEGMIIQDWLSGTPASVSVIGTGRDSRAIAVNEQLIGAPWAGADLFRYIGNITPLELSPSASCKGAPQAEMAGMAEMAEEIVSELGLIGSNGVDFLLTENGPVVVEVNPRFQGSLDVVEMSTGKNVFQAHVDAFRSILPERPVSKNVAGRAILFADEPVGIGELLTRWITGRDWITDVPRSGSVIKKSDPVASVLAIGRDRTEVLDLLMERTAMLRIATKNPELKGCLGRPADNYQDTTL
jgi:uncharacterized protein